MDQVYKVTMQSATVIANGELVTIRAATAYASRASKLSIIRMSCGQTSTTTSAQLSIRWGLKAAAFGTFTAATPAPTAIGTVASGIAGGTAGAAATAGTNASANGAGALTVLGQEAFNNLNGWLWVPTPEERIIVGPDLTFVLQLQGTPSALTGWSADVTFMELN